MKRFIFVLIVVSLFFSCSKEEYKRFTKGSENIIVTVADDSLWSEIEDLIASNVEKTIRTPQREKLFYFSHVSIERFKDLQYAKNIMFITTLDNNDTVSNFVKAVIPENGIKMIKSGSRNLFNEFDKIAHRQNFMVLAANNKKD